MSNTPQAPQGGKYRNVGLSMEPELFAAAKAHAKSIGLPFSTYVQQLIRRDIGQDNVLDPPQSPPQSGGSGSGSVSGFMRAI